VKISYTKHAIERMNERGTNKNEVDAALKTGQTKPDNFGRIKYIQVFANNSSKSNKKNKQVEVSAELKDKATNHWTVITVIVKFY